VVVDDVLLGEEANGVLPAVITFNATITSEVGVRNLTGSYIRVDLVEHDGGWRVDDMLYLASQGQALTPAPDAEGGTPPAPEGEGGG
jgi:hypothetical protein